MATNFNNYYFQPIINDVLQNLGFKNPTYTQTQVIPHLLKKKNLVCQAWTGSGKTHAFLLPIINKINVQKKETQAIILCPTKELIYQTKKFIYDFQKLIPNLKVESLVGGIDNKTRKTKIVKNPPHIILSTPAQLKVFHKNGIVKFNNINFIVLDECDMLIKGGFINDLIYLWRFFPLQSCKSVFSATISKALFDFIRKFMKLSLMIDLNKNQNINKNIENILVYSKYQNRYDVLIKILDQINPYLCLIFVNKKIEIQSLYNLLRQNNYKTIFLSSDLSLRQRLQNINQIKKLKYYYVICTDIAARGLDIEGVSHVISVNFPNNLEFYIHRAGRTGRINNEGKSYVIYDNSDDQAIKTLNKQGVNFNYYRWKQNKLIFDKNKKNINKIKKTIEYDVKNILNKYNKKKKIKPNYKNKRKKELIKLQNEKKKVYLKTKNEKTTNGN